MKMPTDRLRQKVYTDLDRIFSDNDPRSRFIPLLDPTLAVILDPYMKSILVLIRTGTHAHECFRTCKLIRMTAEALDYQQGSLINLAINELHHIQEESEITKEK